MSTVDRQRKFQEHLDKALISINDTHPEYPNKALRELIDAVGWLADEVFLVLKPKITPETERTETNVYSDDAKEWNDTHLEVGE